MKKRIALTCKDPGQFFRDCPGCQFFDGCDFFNKSKRKKKDPEITLKMKDRVVLFFSWATGEGDYIELPFGLLAGAVRMLMGYNQYFIPIVQVGKKKFYFLNEKGTLKPLWKEESNEK